MTAAVFLVFLSFLKEVIGVAEQGVHSLLLNLNSNGQCFNESWEVIKTRMKMRLN